MKILISNQCNYLNGMPLGTTGTYQGWFQWNPVSPDKTLNYHACLLCKRKWTCSLTKHTLVTQEVFFFVNVILKVVTRGTKGLVWLPVFHSILSYPLFYQNSHAIEVYWSGIQTPLKREREEIPESSETYCCFYTEVAMIHDRVNHNKDVIKIGAFVYGMYQIAWISKTIMKGQNKILGPSIHQFSVACLWKDCSGNRLSKVVKTSLCSATFSSSSLRIPRRSQTRWDI